MTYHVSNPYPTLLFPTLPYPTLLFRAFRWLTDVLQLESREVRRLLTLVPDVLHASMEETLLPACDWLMGAARCDMSGVGQILTRCSYRVGV